MDIKKLYEALVNLEKASQLLRQAGELDGAADELDTMYDSLNNTLCEAQETAEDVKGELYFDDDEPED